MNSKECTKCGESKPMNAFYSNGIRKKRAQCAICYTKDRLEHYHASPAAREAEARKAARHTPEAEGAREERKREYHAGRKRDCSPEANRAKLARRRTAKKLSADEREVSTAYRRAIAADPCFYCGSKSTEMHDDHKLPLAKGGTDHWWNLARACAACNLSKGAKTAEEFLTERAV